jgi:uncharacterized protein YgbK (DUF1537 family)
MTQVVLGCIADDFTGATDLANNLVRAGMRVVQTIGVPPESLQPDADAVVVALKSRTIPAAEAVGQSLAALRWLQGQGCQQFYFKYCSTFDSTSEGNIGPVTDALMDAVGTDFTIACPAFPENGRTVFKGYLFVGDELLHESGMRNHPLTPMHDSNLVRVLQSQTSRRVGLIAQSTIAQGDAAIARRISELRSAGVGMAIVDAISNADLMVMGKAFAGLPLLTAGSGVAIGLPQNFGISPAEDAARLPPANGLRAIVSGSCSTATNSQVAHFLANGGQGFPVDPLELASGTDVAAQALEWASSRIAEGPVLVYATAAPESVKAVQAKLGSARAGEIVEHALASVARGLAQRGVGQLVVAGGETSGACVQALGIDTLRIGQQIAPGVPWCHAASSHAEGGSLHIALKSGNFGATDFFTSAFRLLD